MTIPAGVIERIAPIRFFLAENLRTTRRFLSSLKVYPSIEHLAIGVLDKDTPVSDLRNLMNPLHEGFDLGILSEAGCPGVADPGARAVQYAHEHGFQVVPLVGPSSLLLALMASGLNGQNFSFHGYLPVDQAQLARSISKYEQESRLHQQTKIFIETPYRTNSLLKALCKSLHPGTKLCLAIDITGPEERIICKKVGDWGQQELPKLPAVFLFQA